MLPSFFIATILTVLTANASALSNNSLLLHEKRDSHPSSFTSQGPAAPDTSLHLRIALVQKDVAGLKDKLMDVSTPGNAAYGQHLSKEEVSAYISPRDASFNAVQSWLMRNNLTSVQASPAGDWIGFTTSVKQANALLDANFTTYTNAHTGDTAIRTLAYSLPAYLKDDVELIHPTVSFPGLRRTISVAASRAEQIVQARGAPTSCDSQGVTPTCLQEHYNIPTTAATQASNRIVVTGLHGGQANQSNLQNFLKMYRPDISPSTTFTLQALDEGSDTQGPVNATVLNDSRTEADLDVQYTVGLATGVPVTFISVDDTNHSDAYSLLAIAQNLIAETSPPTVWTTSYGMDETDLSPRFANKICLAYAALGVRGTSVLFASGDGGISGPQLDNNCSSFVPTFPSGCPFVTSVGATKNVDPEVAASLSAGGFSNVFPTPSYQTSAKAKYFSDIGSAANAGLYNTSGRGYPDVAAIGFNVPIISNGTADPTLVDGTSCSSPIFASVIALLNDELIAAGRPPLGFLNPWLYSNATTAFNDITTGSNPGCNTKGFYTMAGWDPVTGLGSPDFGRLRTAAGLL